MKEYDFLQILEAVSGISKDVKVELEACLKLRNSCGHPIHCKSERAAPPLILRP